MTNSEAFPLARRGMQAAIQRLDAGSFAVVMATEIVSISLHLDRRPVLSDVFMGLGAMIFGLLVVAYIWRAISFRAAFLQDLRDPGTMFGFLTLTAGADVLAKRLWIAQLEHVAAALIVVGVVSWVAVTYLTVTWLFVMEPPASISSVNGSWLLTVVGAQSVSIALTTVAQAGGDRASGLLFASFAFWAAGLFFYLFVMALISYRIFFMPMEPEDVHPSYWINMGAAAITVLAATQLVNLGPRDVFISHVAALVGAAGAAAWAWGSWWIPLLAIGSVWRLVRGRRSLAYDPSQWSIVFPLGMYASATFGLSRLPGLFYLLPIARLFTWAALVAWVVVAVLFAVRQTRHRSPPASALGSPPTTSHP